MTRDFTVNISGKEMAAFVAPLMFVKLFEQISGIVNTAVMSRILSTEVMTCISACRVYPQLQTTLIGMTATGFGLYVTRQIGSNDKIRQKQAVAQACTGAVILTLAGFVVLLVLKQLLDVAKIPDSLQVSAEEYLFWLFIGSGALAFQNLFFSIMYGLGESAFAGSVSAVGVVLQPSFTFLFSYTGKLGIRAVPLASMTCRLILSVVLLGYLLWRYRELFWDLPSISRNLLPGRELLSCGFSRTVMMLIVWCGSFLIQRQVNQMPAASISAYMYAIVVEDFFLVPVYGVEQASSYILAQNAGSGNTMLLKRYYRRMVRQGLMVCAGVMAAVCFFAPAFVRFAAGDAGQEVLILADRWLQICKFAFPALTLSLIGRMFLQAVGSYRQMTVLGVMEGILRMAFAVFVMADSGFNAVIWSFFCIFWALGIAFGICCHFVLRRLEAEYTNGV